MPYACRSSGYERDGKSRTRAYMAFNAYLPTLCLDQSFHQCESKPGAARLVPDVTEPVKY